MRKIERKSLIISLAITIIITGTLMYLLQIKSNDNNPLVKVIVAATNINGKAIIKDTDIAEIFVPEKIVIPGSIRNKAEVIGKISKENIYYGEAILKQNLLLSGFNNGLSSEIEEGYRAVAIKLDLVDSVGGLIKRGDKVDLLLFITPPYTSEEKIQTIFQNIEILDIQGNSKEYVILSMTPQDSQKLFLSDQIGKIKFTLRKIVDNKKIDIKDINVQIFNGEEWWWEIKLEY